MSASPSKDGRTLSQSNAIHRYVGKLSGLYPTDPWQAALCDEIMDVVEEVTEKLVATFSITEDNEKRSAREALAKGPLSFRLQKLQERLEERGGKYFADQRLTVADLKVFVWLRHLRSGQLDHIPTDLAEDRAPLLVEHHDRVSSHPGIKSYYARRTTATAG